MVITVNVQLVGDETLAYAPDAAAMQVLVALGGNATKDTCILTLVAPSAPGIAGVDPAPPPPP
jgi:hypothetical protein